MGATKGHQTEGGMPLSAPFLPTKVKFVIHCDTEHGAGEARASPPRDNKLLAVPRGIGLHALRRRLADLAAGGSGDAAADVAPGGAPTTMLRYRLPGELEQEGLVELSNEEDFALMLEEYDALQARSPHGGPASRLHVYVSSLAPPPPSPRSVLRRWQRAAATSRRKASRSPSRGSSADDVAGGRGRMMVDAGTDAADVAQQPQLRLPASLTEDGPPGFASMLSLAEAVVADVLDQPPARTSSSCHHALSGVRGVQHISADDMELGPRIGDGTYAVVHAGWWRGAAVAVKILRAPHAATPQRSAEAAAAAARAAAAFSREAALLARLQHPNVLALYGVVGPGAGPPAAILELMPHGSLRAALRARPGAPRRATAAALALGAARAMQHLHAQSPPVIHFDLKADNLLVDWRDAAAPVCKLADLGLACSLAQPGLDDVAAAHGGAGDEVPFALSPARAAGRGTLWWMAPELFPAAATSAPIDVRVDVFSFGVVMWEIASGGAEPYSPGASPDAVMAAVRAGVRPPPPPGCDPAWAALMAACWAAEPAARPQFSDIVPILARMAVQP